MQIEKHISDLLYRYQCVTVPGFGAFLTETVSAHVTGSASSFFPHRNIENYLNRARHSILHRKQKPRKKWKPNYPKVSGLMGAAPCRADSRNMETKKSPSPSLPIVYRKIAIVNNFC